MKELRPIFFASFFFSFHLALLSYLNSTVLAQHVSSLQTTLTYTVSSMLSFLLIVIAPRAVRRIGASKFLIIILVLSMILLGLLGTIGANNAFVTLFIIYFSLDTVAWYAFDLVIEHYSREQVTGNIRGIYLTLNNAGWVTAPVVASIIIAYAGFNGTYLVASVIVLIALLLITTTTTLPATYRYTPKISLLDAFRALVAHVQARRIVTVYFVIQFFYALMIIYMAPYLLKLGFSWSTIGVIFSIMLLPYVLLQYWGGKIADRFHAEKQLIAWGFGITALTTAILAFPIPSIAAIFAGILFLTRVGASIIEIGCESAFFKEVTDRDTALIGTLRMTLPLAYIIAPLGGALLLSFGSIQLLFGALAVILLLAMAYTFRLKKRQ